jgi:hypothetical protein
MKPDINYERDIKIDVSALDLEWDEQPILMMKYTQHAAQMRKELDEAKQALDIARAEADRTIREDPGSYDISKVTEAAISSAILTYKPYIEASNALIQAKYEADMASGAVSAFSQRKDALEHLVRLFGLQYFAGPKVIRDILAEKESRNSINSSSDAGIASRLNRERPPLRRS